MHITIVDDERVLTNKISKKLKLNGHSVSEFFSFNEFMQNGIDSASDLYIVDISLGDGSGFDVLRILREDKKLNTPIIIISGFGDTQNIIFGLNIGADDYITKPFIPDELLARINAVTRRPPEIKSKDLTTFKNITINNITKEVSLNGEILDLTKKEVLLVEIFIKNVGKLVEKDKVIKYVWGAQSAIDVGDNTINVTISRLRKKLGDSFSLQTRNNLGYILDDF